MTPADTRTGERPVVRADEPAELVRLRVLWYALRVRGLDACGAPGIAYDRPVVQSSPQQPAAPHGYGMGHARATAPLRAENARLRAEVVRLRAELTVPGRAHPALTAGPRDADGREVTP